MQEHKKARKELSGIPIDALCIMSSHDPAHTTSMSQVFRMLKRSERLWSICSAPSYVQRVISICPFCIVALLFVAII
jgi:hypothetical protein